MKEKPVKFCKINGDLKRVNSIVSKINGEIKQVKEVYTKINGEVKRLL